MMINETIKGVSLIFETDDILFSPLHIDVGTLALLSTVEFLNGDKVLDLGCGYGVVGIIAAKLIGKENVVLSDNDVNAIRMAKKNADFNGVDGIKIVLSNGFDNIDENDFTLILSNPPYHTDFSIAKHFIEKGFNRLQIGGRMLMVTKRKDWYKNKLIAIFGGVKVSEINGYYVFCSEKRTLHYANSKRSK